MFALSEKKRGENIMFYILMAVLFLNPDIKKASKKSQIIRGILGLITGFILFYIFNMDRSISFILSSLWIPALFQIISSGILRKKGSYSKTLIKVMTMILIFSIGYKFYPYDVFGAKKLAGMVPVKESNDTVSKIDAAHVIVISPETAYYEMQKMIGTLDNPSVYKIGQLGVTMTKDGACYVAPIEVDGFFRALSNKEIPGVMYVSAEKPSEAKVIKSPAKYAESFVFGKDLARHLRKYKPGSILFQTNAELDDEGNVYYVGSYGHYKYGRKGPVMDGVLLFSFNDGKVSDYSKDKVPSWVDEVYPSDVSESYNSYFGSLKKGLINRIFIKEGVHIPTAWKSQTSVDGLSVNSKEVTGVIDSDGKLKWFTDHTNTSSTSTTMTGYSIMNMRTGDMIYYKTPGYINGKGAMNAVDKTLGANKANWTPVQPLFYNIFGTEAWVVPVVNKTDGALVKVAIVAAQNSYVILEDNKDSAIESFKNAIAYGKISSTSNKNANSIKAEEKIISGKVSRITPVTENGNTIFYVKLLNNNTVFMVNKSSGIDIVLTKENDDVQIKYMDIKDNNVVSAVQFKNNSIK